MALGSNPTQLEVVQEVKRLENDKLDKADISATGGANIGSVGTPTVEVVEQGGNTVFVFNFLKGQKGDKGDKGDVTTPTLSINDDGELVVSY